MIVQRLDGTLQEMTRAEIDASGMITKNVGGLKTEMSQQQVDVFVEQQRPKKSVEQLVVDVHAIKLEKLSNPKTLSNGMKVDPLNTLFDRARGNPNARKFAAMNGSFTISNTEVIELDNHIQSIEDHAADLQTAIAAAPTEDARNAIDIKNGWPT